ncbi:MAG: hypothetical protein WAK93_17625 [Solirubrobacteraceae bacterium]
MVTIVTALAVLGLVPAAASAHTWSVTRMDNVGGLTSISCPSANLCVAADDSLHLVSSRKPLGPASAWHRFRGRGWPGNDGNPSDYFGQPSSYNGVACVSPRLCVAVDNDGDIVASKHPAGGRSAWHGALVDCGECLMANDGDLTAVACTPTAVCVGAEPADGDYNTRHPFNLDDWNGPFNQTTAPYGIACGPGGLCLQYGRGVIATSIHPGAPNPAWQQTVVDPGHNIDGISCPSAAMCVGVDHRGNVLSSTDPADPTPQWNVVNVDGTTPLEGISCPSTSLCVAIDNHGDTVSSANPTAGAQAWRVTRVDGHRFMTAISCASSSLCVAVDRHGDAVSAKHPGATVGS